MQLVLNNDIDTLKDLLFHNFPKSSAASSTHNYV